MIMQVKKGLMHSRNVSVSHQDGATTAKKKFEEEKKIKIYCVCRMPELPTTKLIECSLCKE